MNRKISDRTQGELIVKFSALWTLGVLCMLPGILLYSVYADMGFLKEIHRAPLWLVLPVLPVFIATCFSGNAHLLLALCAGSVALFYLLTHFLISNMYFITSLSPALTFDSQGYEIMPPTD